MDYDTTLAAVQETVDGYPGLVRDVQTYLKERIREVLTGASDSVVIRLYGPDLEVLRTKADEVRRAAAFLMQGEEVGDIFQGGKTYDVNVWSTPGTRNSVNDISNLLIDTPAHGQVRLADVADVRIVSAPNVIEREGQSRKTDVSANVRGRDLGAVIQDVETALQTVDFPLEYRAEILGEFTERQAAQRSLAVAGLVAVMGIFFLLYNEGGEFVAAPTWIAGQAGARPGVKMWAEPHIATAAYYQGWGPEVEWSDFGRIVQTGQESCVPVDCYKDVLVIAESSLGESGAAQLKYFARGVGQVRVGWQGTDSSQEDLQLVEFERLDAPVLAEVHAAALAMEQHAYAVSTDVYGRTSPMVE